MPHTSIVARLAGHEHDAQFGHVQLSLSTGRTDGIGPQHVLGTLVNEAGIPRHAVGKIRIREAHTLVDVPAHFADRVLGRSRPLRVGRQQVQVERA